jgi:hypothetical protein
MSGCQRNWTAREGYKILIEIKEEYNDINGNKTSQSHTRA